MMLPVPLNTDAAVWATFENAAVEPAPLPSANPTKSFWLDSDPSANPLAKVGSTGPLPNAADVVIIGSGMTGSSAAYHLANLVRNSESEIKSVSAVILEARDFCSGATGRNGGHLTPVSVHNFRERVKLHGKDEALRDVELERYTVSSVLKFLEKTPNAAEEVDLVKEGHVTLLFSPEEVEAVRADMSAAAEAGLDLTGIEWLEPDVMHDRFRVRLPGVFGPGHTIWPLKLVTKLFEDAKGTKAPDSWFGRATSLFTRAGPPTFSLDLFTQAPVDAVEPLETEGAYRWLVKSNRGAVKARYVIHATNAYASHILPQLAGPVKGIVPTRAQCVTVQGIAKAKDWPKVGWGANQGYEYWFGRQQKKEEDRARVVLGGGRETAVPHHEFNVADDSSVHPAISATLRGFLPTLFPQDFEAVEPEMEWTGIMGFTRDGNPIVGPVYENGKPLVGQYIAAGYSGHGMPRAFACAEVVAQMIYAEMLGNSWSAPEWFPRHLLTKEASSIEGN